MKGYIKFAVIKPQLKKPIFDPDVFANYRPTVYTTSPFFCNTLEKLKCYLSGLRIYHSTETALAQLINDLLIASDNGLISILALLDLGAAFDTISQKILLQRLENVIGIKGTTLGWL